MMMGTALVADECPEGYEERLVDGFWGIPTLLDKIEADVRRELDEGRTAVTRWKVIGEKT